MIGKIKNFLHDLKHVSFTFIELSKCPKTEEDQIENIKRFKCLIMLILVDLDSSSDKQPQG